MKFQKFILPYLTLCIISFSLSAQENYSQRMSTSGNETTRFYQGQYGYFLSKSRSSHIFINDTAGNKVDNYASGLLKIGIPAGTKYWYYCFSTTNSENSSRFRRISSELNDRLIKSEMDRTDIDLSGLVIPEGTDSVNIFLLDPANAIKFIKQPKKEEGTFDFIYEGTVKNRTQGIVLLKNINDTSLCFGITKAGKADNFLVDIEFVFVMDSSQIDIKSNGNSYPPDFFNDNFFSSNNAINLGNSGWKAFQNGNYDACLRISNKALESDNSFGFIHFNIALVYLIKGENHKAVKKYKEAIAITLKEVSTKHDLEGAIEDINTYMPDFPSKKVANKILKRLKAIQTK